MFDFAQEDQEEFCSLFFSIFVLLSMIETIPFWEQMGLAVSPSSILHETAKHYVEQYIAGLSLEPKEELIPRNKLLEDAFTKISQETNTDTAETLVHWGKNTYVRYPEEDNSFSTWIRLLYGLTLTDFPEKPIPLDLPQSKRAYLGDLSESYRAENEYLKTRIDELEKQPRTPWTEVIYSHYKYGSPLNWMALQIQFRMAAVRWKAVSELLNDAEYDLLETWGYQFGPLVNLPPTPIVRRFNYEAIGL